MPAAAIPSLLLRVVLVMIAWQLFLIAVPIPLVAVMFIPLVAFFIASTLALSMPPGTAIVPSVVTVTGVA